MYFNWVTVWYLNYSSIKLLKEKFAKTKSSQVAKFRTGNKLIELGQEAFMRQIWIISYIPSITGPSTAPMKSNVERNWTLGCGHGKVTVPVQWEEGGQTGKEESISPVLTLRWKRAMGWKFGLVGRTETCWCHSGEDAQGRRQNQTALSTYLLPYTVAIGLTVSREPFSQMQLITDHSSHPRDLP